MDVREKLLNILEDSGIFIDRDNIQSENDIDLREYITDSIQFISFIVEIEKELNMEFPDEYLLYDKIASLNGFSAIIESFISGEYALQNELLQADDPLEDDDYDEDDPYTDRFEGEIDESWKHTLFKRKRIFPFSSNVAVWNYPQMSVSLPSML